MSQLTTYEESAPHTVRDVTTDHATITTRLAAIGVRFERWTASVTLTPEATDAAVIAAYRGDIDRLMTANGYQSVDVLRCLPDNPQRETLRAKFLNEHTHDDDEVRFFVEGGGMFYLRIGGAIHAVLCTRGDLISVPAHTRHWFDMGPLPHFTAVRLYISPEGWVANFTGDPIAAHLPAYNNKIV